ncbi:MAG: LPP20 family lipoprotein [Phycisphaerae bacterium]|nr:LPP20 family lipoprotein [Phycisphaerae bacterium]
MSKATKLCIVLLGLAVLVAWTVPAMGDAVSEKRKAQNKLLARRAARVDAMRKLAERISGLIITSETTVKDFVATNDRIQTAMMAYLSGMKEVGEPKYLPDGTCEVTLEVTLKEIIVTLKRFHSKYYKGGKISVQDFDKMTIANEVKVLRETGSGAPRPEFEERGILVSKDTTGQSIMSKGAWAYWGAHCTGRGRLMAARAARVVALRRLGERIQGLWITSETTVRDFVAESDEIRTQMDAFIRGAREVGTRYHENELIVEVDMEVTVRSLIASLKRWHQKYYKGGKISVRDFEKISLRTEEKTVRETGMGVPPEKYLKDLGDFGMAAIAFAELANNWPPMLRVTGNAAIDIDSANPAQAKLMAFRAAELDARRKLAEEIDGLLLTSSTTVRDFIAQDDQIRTSMLTYQQGVRRIKDSEKIMEDGTVETTVEIDTEPLWNMVLYYQEKLAVKIK